MQHHEFGQACFETTNISLTFKFNRCSHGSAVNKHLNDPGVRSAVGHGCEEITIT